MTEQWHKFTELRPSNLEAIIVYVEDRRQGYDPYMCSTLYQETDVIENGCLIINSTLYAEYWHKMPRAPK
jgi:hypothetical protein